MNNIEKQIINNIDNFSDDILDFTCRLVAEPSTLGNEASAFFLAGYGQPIADPHRSPIWIKASDVLFNR